MTKRTGPKIGLTDIETSPIEGRVWGLWDNNLSLAQITEEWSILSFCVMPLFGKKKDIKYFDTSDQENPRDDYELCGALWEMLEEYDILITQNGKRFDLKKIKARLIMHGFPPPSPVKIEDTLLMAKAAASFTSNKLEWMSEKFSKVKKLKHNDYPGWELWNQCLAGNPKAWASMRAYNIVDVISLQDVYLTLLPWVTQHTNVAVYSDEEGLACNKCGHATLEESGFTYTNVGKYQRYNCATCLSWSRGRKMLNSKAKRESLVV